MPKKPPAKSEEQKAAEAAEKEAKAIQKANDNFFKAVKDDEVKKCEDWKAKGADINYINDKGHSAVHVAAAFGALNVLRYLHKQGASFETINAVSPRRE